MGTRGSKGGRLDRVSNTVENEIDTREEIEIVVFSIPSRQFQRRGS